MPVRTQIFDGTFANYKTKVTKRGQLVVAPLEYSDTYFNLLNVDDQAFNFIKAKPTERFVITGIVVDGDRNIGANGATVDIYEASSSDSTTINKSLFEFDVVKQGSKLLTGLNIITTEGVFINAKSSDSNIAMSILGYYVSA